MLTTFTLNHVSFFDLVVVRKVGRLCLGVWIYNILKYKTLKKWKFKVEFKQNCQSRSQLDLWLDNIENQLPSKWQSTSFWEWGYFLIKWDGSTLRTLNQTYQYNAYKMHQAPFVVDMPLGQSLPELLISSALPTLCLQDTLQQRMTFYLKRYVVCCLFFFSFLFIPLVTLSKFWMSPHFYPVSCLALSNFRIYFTG